METKKNEGDFPSGKELYRSGRLTEQWEATNFCPKTPEKHCNIQSWLCNSTVSTIMKTTDRLGVNCCDI